MENLKNVGLGYINTPVRNKDMQESKKRLTVNPKECDIDTPSIDELSVSSGVGGMVLNLVTSSGSFPIGNFVFSSEKSSSREEIEGFMGNAGLQPKIVGQEGMNILVSWFPKVGAGGKIMKVAAIHSMTLADAETEAKNRGYSDEEISARIYHMKHNWKDVPEWLMAWVISHLGGAHAPEPRQHYVESGISHDKFGNPVESTPTRVLRAWSVGIRFVLLDGPMASGKTSLAKDLCWVKDIEYRAASMSNGVDESLIQGDYITDNHKIEVSEDVENALSGGLKGLVKKGALALLANLGAEVFKPTVVFEPGMVSEMMIKANEAPEIGACCILDEFNMMPAGVASTLNAITDGSQKVFIRGLGDVPVDDEFYVIGTLNGIDCDYAGTLPVNTATKSRFKYIRMENPSGSVLNILNSFGTGASTELLSIADKVFCKIRDMYYTQNISGEAVNMRAFKRILQEVSEGGSSFYAAFRDNILSSVDTDEADVIYTALRDDGLLKP